MDLDRYTETSRIRRWVSLSAWARGLGVPPAVAARWLRLEIDPVPHLHGGEGRRSRWIICVFYADCWLRRQLYQRRPEVLRGLGRIDVTALKERLDRALSDDQEGRAA